MAHLNSSIRFSKLDALAHSQILALVEIIRPVGPDGCYVARDHPLLSLPALQTYYDLYFSRFNTAYPIIHQATFEPSKVDTLLLISVLLLGATYGEKDAHQLAVGVYVHSFETMLIPSRYAFTTYCGHRYLLIIASTRVQNYGFCKRLCWSNVLASLELDRSSMICRICFTACSSISFVGAIVKSFSQNLYKRVEAISRMIGERGSKASKRKGEAFCQNSVTAAMLRSCQTRTSLLHVGYATCRVILPVALHVRL